MELLRQLQFERFVAEAFVVAQGQPVLIDKFLRCDEVDVDAIRPLQGCCAGVMDILKKPSPRISLYLQKFIGPSLRDSTATEALAMELQVCGLMNIQFAEERRRRI